MQATLTFLGSGTSMGVPTLGCDCAVCLSAVSPAPGDPRLLRTTAAPAPPSSSPGRATTSSSTPAPTSTPRPCRESIRRLDAVLYTHGHADHVLGMDDLRPLSFHYASNLPLYADEPTAAHHRAHLQLHLPPPTDRYPTSARVALHRIPTTPGAEVALFGARFLRIPVTHGRQTITGYRFGSAAYLTDLSDIPAESLPLLADLDILILDALRREPHPTHSHLDKSIAFVEQLKPRRAFFTHISHDLDHDSTNAMLPPHIRLAYDGLQLTFDIATRIS